MNIHLQVPEGVKAASLQISGSKSETNRLLLLHALYPGISINNASESDDSEAMRKALSANNNIDIHHAGTAMRFLTAYFAIQEGNEVEITGSKRMKERPIGVLVEALRSLGGNIVYSENEGFPPLKITGKKLQVNKVTIKADVSSQYITALLLIAAKLEKGLEITLDGEITSRPYFEMTLALLAEVGIEYEFKDNTIFVKPLITTINNKVITVESDWSSASYFYSIVALADVGTSISLTSYKQNSLQGDSALAEIYSGFGVDTVFNSGTIVLHKTREAKPAFLNLINTPDIAQTIAVTCFGLGIGCYLTGLHTLKIKETDRLEALKTELEKFGAVVDITNDSLKLEPHSLFDTPNMATLNYSESVNTYNDHRMAMAFAPLAIKLPFGINDAEVVSKSYPVFWDDLKKCGFVITTL